MKSSSDKIINRMRLIEGINRMKSIGWYWSDRIIDGMNGSNRTDRLEYDLSASDLEYPVVVINWTLIDSNRWDIHGKQTQLIISIVSNQRGAFRLNRFNEIDKIGWNLSYEMDRIGWRSNDWRNRGEHIVMQITSFRYCARLIWMNLAGRRWGVLAPIRSKLSNRTIGLDETIFGKR